MPLVSQSPSLAKPQTYALGFFSVFLTAWLGMKLGADLELGAASLIWAPSGIAVALVVRFGCGMLVATGFGVLSANILTGLPLFFSVFATLGNVLEPFAAYLLLRRFAPAEQNRTKQVLRFCLVGLAAPLASAVPGNLGLLVSNMTPPALLPQSIAVWWLGNALGILVVGPLVLALTPPKATAPFSSSRLENVLLPLSLLVCSLLVYGGILAPEITASMAFVFVPLAVWAGLRMGLQGQSATVFCIALVSAIGTWNGYGPFAQNSLLANLATLGAFLLVISFTALLTGAVTAERRRMEKQLQQGQQQLQLLINNFPEGGVALLDERLRVVLAGGLGLQYVGLDGEAMQGQELISFFPDSVNQRLKPALEDAMQGKTASTEAELNGRIYQVLVQPVPDEDMALRHFLLISHDLTERVHAEEALAGSYVFLQRTLDSIHHPVFIKTSAGKFRFVNKAFCELLRLSPQEIIGKTVHDIAPPELAALYETRDRELLESGQQEQRYSSKAKASDGQELHLYFCKSLVHDPVSGDTDIVGLTMDISELHEANKALEASETKYRTLFEEMGLAALVADVETGELLDANQQACALWQYSKEELLAMKQPDLHPPELRETAQDEFCEHARQGGGLGGETSILTGTGLCLDVEVDTVVLQHQGKPALMGLFKDISERKKLEQLRQDVEMMSRHDLKSPLNAVIGLPYVLMESENLSEEQREIASIIQEAGRRMLQIVNLSLGLYKMETGSYEMQPQPVDLLSLLRDIEQELQPLAEKRKLSLQVQVDNELCPVVDPDLHPFYAKETFLIHGEGLLCYSMFANLLKNAYEASPSSGVISVRLSCSQGQARIEIHNQGAVPAAIRDNFFKKYVSMGKKEGTGLGAYSARLIAETHQGSITMQSTDAEGTTLTVWLPAVATSGATAA